MTTLPARYSVGQPDFDHEVGRSLLVRVDGVEQAGVIEYDCESGTLLRNKLDADGKVMLNEAKDDRETETVMGNVTVEWRRG